MSTRYSKTGNYTKDNYDEYWKNGFIILKNLVSSEHCDYSNLLAREVANKDFAQVMHLHREDFLVAQCSEKLSAMKNISDRVLFYQKIKRITVHYTDFLKLSEIVNYLEWLYQKHMVGLLTNMFFKEPNSKYSKQSWQAHQDNSYLGNENGMYITVNVAYGHMSKKNGGLRLYPGSHKIGRIDAENKISYRDKDGKPGNKIKIKLPMSPVQINLEKGDVLFMHGLCVHESSDNNSNIPRPLLSLGYMPFGENFDPGFNSKRKALLL
jgi:ectoine hydroxylase-related dioxygenase (phytanoyl-CoA dioxygenase family)